jgi:hypothetical protein
MPEKKLENIRPAKGAVKLKNRPKTPPEKNQPNVNLGVAQDKPGQELPPPTEEASKIVMKLNELRQELMGSMRSFNELMKNSKLPENRSMKEKNEEQAVISKMVNVAGEIDKYSKGEGSLAVCIFAVRVALSVRDAGNYLAYEIHQLKERINDLGKKENGS